MLQSKKAGVRCSWRLVCSVNSSWRRARVRAAVCDPGRAGALATHHHHDRFLHRIISTFDPAALPPRRKNKFLLQHSSTAAISLNRDFQELTDSSAYCCTKLFWGPILTILARQIPSLNSLAGGRWLRGRLGSVVINVSAFLNSSLIGAFINSRSPREIVMGGHLRMLAPGISSVTGF